MRRKEKIAAGFMAVAILTLPVILIRRRPAVAAELTGLLYSLDGVIWIGLEGATLERPDVYLGVSWVNRSDVELTTMVVLALVNPEGEESEHPFEQTLAPGEEKRHEIFVSLREGNYSFTATIYEADTMKILDVEAGTFSVVMPQPKGMISQLLYQEEGALLPQVLNGSEIALARPIDIIVTWQNTTPDFPVIGHVEFDIVRPDESIESPTATSGQDQALAPGETGSVVFLITPAQLNGCSYEARLLGDIVL